MKILRCVALAVALVAVAASTSGAIGDSSPRAMGLGQSYTALARGPEAVFWNPANLGLSSSPRFKWEVLGVGLTLVAENNSFSVQTYNDNFTDSEHFIDRDVKDDLLGDVPDEGLKFNADVEPILAAGLPINGGVAFPMPWGLKSAVTTGLTIGVEGEVPKDMFELMVFGNEFDRTYDITDWDGSFWLIGSLNWAAAKPWIPWVLMDHLDEMAVGGTLKLLGGVYGEVLRSGGAGLTAQVHRTDAQAFAVAQSGGGIGFGLDLGVAGVLKDQRTTFSVGLLNLLDVMSWSIEAQQDSVFAHASNLRVTRALDVENLEDVLENEDVDGDGDIDFHKTISEDSFSRSLPAMLRVGVAHRPIPQLTLVGNWDQAFSSGFGITTTPRVSAGAEYRLVPWFPTRVGMTVGGRSSGSSIGFSFGPFTVFHMQLQLLDVALVTRGGVLPGAAKGTAISIVFFRFNLVS